MKSFKAILIISVLVGVISANQNPKDCASSYKCTDYLWELCVEETEDKSNCHYYDATEY